VQGHLAYTEDGGGWPCPSEDAMLNTLNLYRAPIILTEVDTNLVEVRRDRLGTQAEWYTRLVNAALRTGRLKGVFFFGGFPDHNSWYELQYHQPTADPTPWDDNFNPKPSYYGLVKSFFLALARR